MSRIVTEDTKKAANRSLDEVQDNNAHKKARDGKRNESLAEEMMYGKKAYKRTVTDTMQERDKRYARLHSFGGNSKVEMMWDIHPDAIRDQVFKIKVGKEEALISAVEIQKYIRWI